MFANTREAYGLIAQLLHWLTAALILVLLSLGIYMHELPADTSAEALEKYWYYSLHKTVGVSAFLVAIVRVVWVATQPRPLPLNGHRPIESLIAATVHWTLYGAIILMPLTGWLHHSATDGFAPIWWPLPQDLPLIPKSPALASFFSMAHYLTAILLGFCIFLHIAGALKHAVVDRDGTLRRMIPGSTPENSESPAHRPFERTAPVLALLIFLGLGAATAMIASTARQAAPSIKAKVPATETGWRVDLKKSRLGIKFQQSGSSVSGSFRNWSARINLNPDDLDRARIDVEIDITSLSLGDMSEQATSSDFLNADAFPIARYVSHKITRTDVDTYKAVGQLTLAGKTRPLTLPFGLTITNEKASAVGQVRLDRLAYGVGAQGFPDDGLVGVEILVQINIEANKSASSK